MTKTLTPRLITSPSGCDIDDQTVDGADCRTREIGVSHRCNRIHRPLADGKLQELRSCSSVPRPSRPTLSGFTGRATDGNTRWSRPDLFDPAGAAAPLVDGGCCDVNQYANAAPNESPLVLLVEANPFVWVVLRDSDQSGGLSARKI